jgi:hypothetical protein
MDMHHKTVKIHDLGLTAALATLGHEVLETKRDTGGRTYFVFAQSKELTDDMNSYWADALNVHARKFFDNIKMLKSRIYGS